MVGRPCGITLGCVCRHGMLLCVCMAVSGRWTEPGLVVVRIARQSRLSSELADVRREEAAARAALTEARGKLAEAQVEVRGGGKGQGGLLGCACM